LTVCIAAASNDGRFVVTATDGQLTFGEITADVMLGKRVWFDDWQCMYAGEPANCQMIFEEMHTIHSDQPLTRENIKTVMLTAYRKRMAASLSPFRRAGAARRNVVGHSVSFREEQEPYSWPASCVVGFCHVVRAPADSAEPD